VRTTRINASLGGGVVRRLVLDDGLLDGALDALLDCSLDGLLDGALDALDALGQQTTSSQPNRPSK